MELMGRRPSLFELYMFEAALREILEKEYATTPSELRNEDD